MFYLHNEIIYRELSWMILFLIDIEHSFPMSILVLWFTNFLSIWRRDFIINVKEWNLFHNYCEHIYGGFCLIFLHFSSSFWKFPMDLQSISENEGKMMKSKNTGGGPEMGKPSRPPQANCPAWCLPRTDSLFPTSFLWAPQNRASRDPLCD